MNTMTSNQQETKRLRRVAAVGKAALLSALLIGTLAVPAQAAAAKPEAPQASVRFARGELASASGVRDVHARVLREANRVCRMRGVRDLTRLRLQQECRAETTRDLLAAIDSERLNNFHGNWEARGSWDAS
ncbi:MAG: UrcA family protein [Gammaproteobacteria bacterium]|nr:MAG: UrcA family protein [Gammaproteobacteria bacterium]